MNMFPEITELELNPDTLEIEIPRIGKTYAYDFQKGDFIIKNGKMVELHGEDTLKVWIEKVLRTEYGRFCIYREVEYGVVLEDLIGSNYPRDFVESEIKREVTTALLRHPHITDIEEWSFERDGKLMRIWFKVITAEDEFEMEVMM